MSNSGPSNSSPQHVLESPHLDADNEHAYMDIGTNTSSPPSSSPVAITPPDCLLDDLEDVELYSVDQPDSDLPCRSYAARSDSIPAVMVPDTDATLRTQPVAKVTRTDWSGSHSRASSFLRRLDCLLQAVQEKQKQQDDSLDCDTVTVATEDTSPEGSDSAQNTLFSGFSTVQPTEQNLASSPNAAYSLSLQTRKRPRSRLRPSLTETSRANFQAKPDRSRDCDPQSKRQKLVNDQLRLARTRSISKRCTKAHSAGLSGAFQLRFAKGPGSLRRAESLRAELQTTKTEEDTLNEVIDDYGQQAHSPSDMPMILGSIASPFGGYAPTVPTTPTAKDVEDEDEVSSVLRRLPSAVPVIAPPPFAFIPRAPLSEDEAAERRIKLLLEKEREGRVADSLCSPQKSKPQIVEDEDEKLWTEETSESYEDSDTETWSIEELLVDKPPSPPQPPESPYYSRIYPSSIDLNIDDSLMEPVVLWFLEVTPDDEYKTYYSPGDLYDLLANSPETRFHAAHLFLRYVLLADPSSQLPPESEDQDDSCESEGELAALEAVVWDSAVACLALSVKFHRDVLFPLDVVYAHEFLDLAPHELGFPDLERAQRAVLTALSFRIGSATPSAFMEELWLALPTLRTLLGSSTAWADVQKEVWIDLLDAVQRSDSLRYPTSLVVGIAVIEGILEILCRRYNSTGIDGRGRAVRRRDPKSLRKIALKASRGVRLDVQDVLQIADVDLLACRKWLGFCEE